MRVSAIDVFCGIGGLSFGLRKAGIPVLAGVDLDQSCRYAYEQNIGAEFISEDIAQVRGHELRAKYWSDGTVLKVLAGCAPCQPFSTQSNRFHNSDTTKKWVLISEFVRLVTEAEPDVVTMENVPNLANQRVLRDAIDAMEANGYSVSHSNVYCPDYGIPQKRRRLVLLASRFGPITLLPRTCAEAEYTTVRQAIGHLPEVEAGKVCSRDPLHRTSGLSALNLRRIRASRPDGTWLDWEEGLRLDCHKKDTGKTYDAVYGRMAWDKPAPTLTTQFYNYGTGRFGHPEQDRALTLREAAILQTFPEDYAFFESVDEIRIKPFGIHIGNAVPVTLGIVIGESILKHLGRYHAKS